MNSLVTAIRMATHRMGFDIVRYHPDAVLPSDFDTETKETWNFVKNYTMASPARIATLCDAVRYVEANKIEGAFVECGVWRGGSMMAAARTLRGLRTENRELYLFDTFEGMPPAQDIDVDPNGNSAQSLFGIKEIALRQWQPEPIEGVRLAMKTTGYPLEKCHFIKGRVEDTIPEQAPTSIALLRLDTDWYESTRHELLHLFPRLAKGGVLIIDDYGYWQGARRAVDEYFATYKPKLFMCRVDDTARMGIVQ